MLPLDALAPEKHIFKVSMRFIGFVCVPSMRFCSLKVLVLKIDLVNRPIANIQACTVWHLLNDSNSCWLKGFCKALIAGLGFSAIVQEQKPSSRHKTETVGLENDGNKRQDSYSCEEGQKRSDWMLLWKCWFMKNYMLSQICKNAR